jgi:hypothetical protein
MAKLNQQIRNVINETKEISLDIHEHVESLPMYTPQEQPDDAGKPFNRITRAIRMNIDDRGLISITFADRQGQRWAYDYLTVEEYNDLFYNQ